MTDARSLKLPAPRAQAAHRWPACGPRGGRDSAGDEPRDRAEDLRRALRHRCGCGQGGEGRAPRLRVRAVGQDEPQRARQAHPQALGAAVGASRGVRPRRVDEQRQDVPGGRPRGRGAGRRPRWPTSPTGPTKSPARCCRWTAPSSPTCSRSRWAWWAPSSRGTTPPACCAGSWGPALAAGCTVVVKPSELTPLTALKLGALALEAGFPPGVLNVVTGYGDPAGEALARHPDVDKISFTGSGRTARRLLQASATSNLKKLTLELGGKSPQIVLPDADFDTAVEACFWGIFGNKGEICNAGSRVLVHEKAYDDVRRPAHRARPEDARGRSAGSRHGDGLADQRAPAGDDPRLRRQRQEAGRQAARRRRAGHAGRQGQGPLHASRPSSET